MMQSSSSDNCIFDYNIKILNIFNQELQLINNKPIIKCKLLSDLINFKLPSILFLEYKNRNNLKIFHWSSKPTASDSDIYEAFKSMHQSIMKKIKNSAGEGWVVKTIVKHSAKNSEC